jgi:multidrug efflux pump subunit AcrB
VHISEFSVRQPVLVNLLVILLLVAAGFTYSYMTKEKFPDVSLDEVWVYTSYPGVSPEEIERLITIPIEDEVASIEGIDDITSVSSEGYSQIEIDPWTSRGSSRRSRTRSTESTTSRRMRRPRRWRRKNGPPSRWSSP